MAPLQNLAHCNLNRAVLGTSLALANSDLVRANLNDSTISGQAALLGSDLAGANLHGAIVSGLDALINAVLNGANLDHARITASAVGVGADLTGVNLNAASITGLGDLSGANVTGTNLHDATISGTGALTGANLTRAHLEEATIAGLTALFGANLTGANLRGASITGTNALEGAVYSHTICPDGTNSDADGGTCAANLTPGADRHVSPRPHASLLRGANAAIAPALVSHGVVVTGGGCNTPGSPAQLAFQYLEPPSSAVAGSSFLASVVIEDSNGCQVTGDSSIPVSLVLDPSSGGLDCSANPVTDTDGISQFSCSIGVVGGGSYTLTASNPSLGSVMSGTITVTAPAPPASPPTPGTVLGGLNLDAYCQSIGYSHSHVPGIGASYTNVEFGPNQAFDWYCVNGAGTGGTSFNMQAACSYEYGPYAMAFLDNPNDAYSWVCVATSTSSYNETDPAGNTYLADGGLGGASGLPDFVFLGSDGSLVAFGGGAGSGGLPDIVDSSPTGTGVTVWNSSGGFEVAESGSLATGGAI